MDKTIRHSYNIEQNINKACKVISTLEGKSLGSWLREVVKEKVKEEDKKLKEQGIDLKLGLD